MMEAERDDSSVAGPQQEEAPSRASRRQAGGACWQHAGLCCFKAKQKTQITALEFKLKKRQKKFGVDYLNLVERKAGQQELQRCLRNAMDEIKELQEEIDRLAEEIEGREEQVQEATTSATAQPESESNEKQDEDRNQNQSKTKKKKSKPQMDDEPAGDSDPPAFTIDSDDDECYEQDQEDEQAPESPQKKKTKKKKKKKKAAQ